MIRLSVINGTQMCRIDHCLLQLVKGTLVHSCAIPLDVCFKHCGHRCRYGLKSFDKLLVNSTQPDKLSNFMDGGRRRPTSNDVDLFGVHVCCIFIDDVSAKGYSGLEER